VKSVNGSEKTSRNWLVLAAFFRGVDDRWLDDFIDTPDLSFEKITPPAKDESWHSKRSGVTSFKRWFQHLQHTRLAFRRRPDGVITCFPPLAMCAAVLKRFSRQKPVIIAYNFNIGSLGGGFRQRLARWVAKQIDVYVVHAPSEVESYAEYLGVHQERVRFVPLQRGHIDLLRKEDTEEPFVLAMGSAHRDYHTFAKAIERIGIPAVIVARSQDIAALPTTDLVTYRSDLTQSECLELLARARVSVTPVANQQTASGQVTFINAMHLGVPIIVTDCPGARGYVDHGRTGLLVPPFDVDALSEAIGLLWRDDDLRDNLAQEGRREAHNRFSDEAAAASLVALIDEFRS
jgi:glycosyltransferase involved in cell wall biosynthesis